MSHYYKLAYAVLDEIERDNLADDDTFADNVRNHIRRLARRYGVKAPHGQRSRILRQRDLLDDDDEYLQTIRRERDNLLAAAEANRPEDPADDEGEQPAGTRIRLACRSASGRRYLTITPSSRLVLGANRAKCVVEPMRERDAIELRDWLNRWIAAHPDKPAMRDDLAAAPADSADIDL
jgi:hypothetical protein